MLGVSSLAVRGGLRTALTTPAASSTTTTGIAVTTRRTTLPTPTPSLLCARSFAKGKGGGGGGGGGGAAASTPSLPVDEAMVARYRKLEEREAKRKLKLVESIETGTFAGRVLAKSKGVIPGRARAPTPRAAELAAADAADAVADAAAAAAAAAAEAAADAHAVDEESGARWQLRAVALVERWPVVGRELLEWEKDFYVWRRKRTAAVERAKGVAPQEHRRVFREDPSIEFDAADERPSLVTDADRLNDVTSVDRAIDQFLYLLVADADADADADANANANANADASASASADADASSTSPLWRFPTATRRASETMRAVAERSVHDECGAELDAFFVGVAPAHCFDSDVDAPPSPDAHGAFAGARCFVYRSHYMGGNVDTATRFRWATKHELPALVGEQLYARVHDLLR